MTNEAQARGVHWVPGHVVRVSNQKHSRQIPHRLYDVITEAMSDAWDEALRILGGLPSDPLPLWTMLARRILAAAGDGERDPERLKRIALYRFDDRTKQQTPLRAKP